jgi:transposase-like protein
MVYSNEEKQRILEIVDLRQTEGETLRQICNSIGVDRKNVYRWRLRQEVSENLDFPEFPDDDISVEEIIEQKKREFSRISNRERAEKWYTIKVKKEEPIAITFIGDPHLDNDGTDWSVLERDIDILSNTENMYAVGIGDYVDNWTGRLERLYADANTSKSRALKLMEWFIVESGIKWMSLILGNHDKWSGPESNLKFICKEQGIHLLDNINRFKVEFPNSRICKVDARHDFVGHSQWNSLHSLQKAAHMKEPANIYVAGHKHNYAVHTEESASKEFIYNLIRVRGYKFIDDYASTLGHDGQKYGASITAIIDPSFEEYHPNFVTVFIDTQMAADYLNFLRSK